MSMDADGQYVADLVSALQVVAARERMVLTAITKDGFNQRALETQYGSLVWAYVTLDLPSGANSEYRLSAHYAAYPTTGNPLIVRQLVAEWASRRSVAEVAADLERAIGWLKEQVQKFLSRQVAPGELAARALSSPDWYDRFLAVTYLGGARATDHLPALERALGDPEASVRIAALQAVVAVGGARLQHLVERALSDEDPDVARAARETLSVLLRSPPTA